MWFQWKLKYNVAVLQFYCSFSFVSHQVISCRFVQETREKVKAGYHMPSPAETPPPVCQIMKDCWNFHPEARPRFSEILRQLKQF